MCTGANMHAHCKGQPDDVSLYTYFLDHSLPNLLRRAINEERKTQTEKLKEKKTAEKGAGLPNAGLKELEERKMEGCEGEWTHRCVGSVSRAFTSGVWVIDFQA